MIAIVNLRQAIRCKPKLTLDRELYIIPVKRSPFKRILVLNKATARIIRCLIDSKTNKKTKQEFTPMTVIEPYTAECNECG